MLERAWAEGVPMRWVVGNSTYGNTPALRQAIATTGRWYVLEIPKSAHIQVGAAAPQTVERLVERVPDDAWSRYALNLSEQGLRGSDWIALRVTSTTDSLAEQWLLIRRTVAEFPDTTYYLSNAPSHTPLDTLAQLGGSRYHVEHLLEQAKGAAGLGQYEVRYWHAWYRHMTLALIAHTWLTMIRHEDAQKRPAPLPFWLLIRLAELACLLNIAWPTPPLTPTFRLACWRWRRAKRMAAIVTNPTFSTGSLLSSNSGCRIRGGAGQQGPATTRWVHDGIFRQLLLLLLFVL